MKIAERFKGRIEIVNPDEKVSIADLAIYNEWDEYAVVCFDTSPECAVFHALEKEYAHEYESYGVDFYEGGWMTFKDGSKLIINRY